MGIISWLILGAISGWLAGIITKKNPKMGCMTNALVGIVGAFIGGMLGTYVFHWGKVNSFNLKSIMISTLGAVILLLILNGVNKDKNN
ncbi:MAG: GlsB/YeaQ/YmgE family stress response membrane protein [Tissierellia bacterium]|nr:GlsB/YeaQ/YmgE family stress response membrane protein [Tissierellia bacterium]